METLYIINPCKSSPFLEEMAGAVSHCFDKIVSIKSISDIKDFKNKKILFSIQLNEVGFCPEMDQFMYDLWHKGNDSLIGSSGILLIHCHNELFTKTYAQNIILHANMLGCSFMGRPIVEATTNLRNFLVLQNTIPKPLKEICLSLCKDLGTRLKTSNPILIKNPKIAVLHSSNFKTSNTLMLWNMIKKHLHGYDISVHHIENGAVKDCIGCSFNTCVHYGEQSSCFYGGIMIEEIYPAILSSDALVFLCPNYNDGLSANISAVINRLTALYRTKKFDKKSIFSVIVSGNSGSDALAKQLISGLNINKAFRLPPYFFVSSIANDTGTILRIDGIEEKAKAFAENIKREIKR